MLISGKFIKTPIEKDRAFEILKQSKESEKKYGKDAVIASTIGTFFDENNNFFILDTIKNNYKNLNGNEIFNYATTISGSLDFKEAIKKSVFGKQISNFDSSHIGITATSGGTGGIYNSFKIYMDKGHT